MTPGALPQNPFPGLRPFTAEESARFFGRDEQIGEALDRLMRQRLLAVVGMSGCGKSSLVTAGMVPALELGLAGDPRQQWRIEIMRPGDGPLRELERCLGFGGGPLAERTYGLREAVKAHLPADQNLLLVVDQFEEIFPFRDRMREGGGSEADLFISYLLSAAQEPAARIYIVLTMRSDYLGECAKFHGLPEALNDGQYLVPRMTRAQLQEAIENPLEAIVGADGEPVQFHQGLVQKLLNDCDEEPDNLPLLQHLLRRLFEKWQQRGAKGQITPAMARDVGELSDALNQDAEQVFEKLASEQQRMAETIFRRITESRRQAGGGTGDRPVRSPQTIAHLAALTEAPDANVRAVVRGFEQRGLLVVRSTDESDKVDLPHECLCLKWNRLKAWIEQEAQDAKALRFLADSVGKSHLTGSALIEAVAWQEKGRLKGAWGERYLSREHVPQVDGWVTESQRRVKEEQERAIRDAERIAEEQRKVAEAQRRAAERTKIGLAAVAVVAAFAIGAAIMARNAEAEAERQATEAGTARVDAEQQKREAERQAAEAGAARSDAVRQKTEAERQATAATTAQKQADDARQSAQASLARVFERLKEQVNSPDAGLVVSALKSLSEGRSVEQALNLILDRNLEENQWVALLAEALDGEREAGRRDWVRRARAGLAARLTKARGISAPPSATDDGKLNARIGIPGGRFQMRDFDGERPVDVSKYWMQEHEVTIEEYRRFDPKRAEGRVASFPIGNVRWYDAVAYAVWLGGSLPTAAQWEFAARGSEGRKYPWGNAPEPDCARANFRECGGLKPVKAGRDAGKTPEEVFDLAGNVWEWCTDLFIEPPSRVLKGGSFNQLLPRQNSNLPRHGARPGDRDGSYGFRVVWSSAGEPD